MENGSPIYIQIAEKLARQIFSGKLRPEMQLPSVREIALIERVNPNTVQRALAKLEEEGLIITKRTNGKFVTQYEEAIMEKRDEYAAELTKAYEDRMREIGAEIRMPKILWMNEGAAEILEKAKQIEEEEKGDKRWFF